MKIVASPGADVAASEVMVVQDAQTEIKKAIVAGYKNGLSSSEIAKQIQIIVYKAGNQVPEERRAEVKHALAVNAQKWHFLYTENMRVHNAETLKALYDYSRKVGTLGTRMNLNSRTYSIDMNVIIKGPANEGALILNKYRPYLTEDRIGTAIIDKYERKVRTEMFVLASDPANLSRIDKNGKAYQVNVRNFAEMKVRYDANLADVKQMKDSGVKLVWTSSHADASPRCAPYQGKLYSMDGTSGTINGIAYTPLEEALLGPRGDGNGIINGYNCRHRIIEYVKGSNAAPKEYDKRQSKREYQVTNRQRQYERNIRNLKTQEKLLRAAKNNGIADIIQSKRIRMEEHYKQFSFSNQRPYIPWRTAVTIDELKAIKAMPGAAPPPIISNKLESTDPGIITNRVEPTPEGIFSNRPIPKTLQSFEEHQSRWHSEVREKFSAKEETIVKDGFEKAIERNDFATRVGPKALESIVLKDGRLKTQFETNTSGGMLSEEYRKTATYQLFGVDSKDMKASDFEKYGYLASKDLYRDINNEYVEHYGEITMRFKKETMLDRTTLTIGDSYDDVAYSGHYEETEKSAYSLPTSVTNIKPEIMSKTVDNLKELNEETVSEADLLASKLDVSYIELQYHGEVTIDDIESVTMYRKVYEDGNQTKMKVFNKLVEKGVRVYQLDDDGSIKEYTTFGEFVTVRGRTNQ